MMRILLYICFLFSTTISIKAQKYVDMSAQLSNITHGMVINGNDYSVTEQVIINTNEINFKKPAYLRFYNVLLNVNGTIGGRGKFNLLQNSMIYVKNRPADAPVSKLYSKKPFGEEFSISKCDLFKGVDKGTSYTIWDVSGKKIMKGYVGDNATIKRMFYTIKIGNKYMDKQLLTD